ncbi:hypothetical protein JHW43_003197 [Diplocarpon mali]|nr:hypothetical protein JHW43_003197 [Diplocarpon mali]
MCLAALLPCCLAASAHNEHSTAASPLRFPRASRRPRASSTGRRRGGYSSGIWIRTGPSLDCAITPHGTGDSVSADIVDWEPLSPGMRGELRGCADQARCLGPPFLGPASGWRASVIDFQRRSPVGRHVQRHNTVLFYTRDRSLASSSADILPYDRPSASSRALRATVPPARPGMPSTVRVGVRGPSPVPAAPVAARPGLRRYGCTPAARGLSDQADRRLGIVCRPALVSGEAATRHVTAAVTTAPARCPAHLRNRPILRCTPLPYHWNPPSSPAPHLPSVGSAVSSSQRYRAI